MLKAAHAVSPRPKLWGVTVLTSLEPADVKLFHPKATVAGIVKSLARLGCVSGLDAIICSAREVPYLRRTLKNFPLHFVTPGIRPSGDSLNDQKRVMTPGEASRLGIDYIVVGRPITAAPDPLRAAHTILAELRQAGETV
jgi:orotidine-5'-phosphate decarboxylase